MKKLTLLFSVVFAFFVLSGQNFVIQQNLEEPFKLMPKDLHNFKGIKNFKDIVYIADSSVYYYDTSGAFQADIIQLLDRVSQNNYPELFYQFSVDMDTIAMYYVGFENIDLNWDLYYEIPDNLFWLGDTNHYMLYDQDHWVDMWALKYINHPIYGAMYPNYYYYIYDQNTHQYTDGYRFNLYFDDNNFLDYGISKKYYPSSQTWEYNSKNIYQTDTNGFVTDLIQQNYELSSSSWVNYERKIYSYNDSGYLAVLKELDWNSSDNQWDSTNKVVYFYQDNLNTEEIHYTWDGPPANAWFPSFKLIREYDSFGRLIHYQRFNYDMVNGWIPSYQYVYTYTDENLTEIIYQIWNTSENNWDNVSRTYYEYQNGLKTLYLYQQWNTADNNWLNSTRDIYTYNSDSLLISDIYQQWDNINDVWVNNKKYEWEFDNKKLTKYSYFEWTSKSWNEKQRKEFYWKEFETKVNDFSIDAKYVYPNPATTFIYLPVETGKATFYSLEGKKIKSYNVSSSRLNISDLPAGFYNVIIDNSNVKLSDKLIKY